MPRTGPGGQPEPGVVPPSHHLDAVDIAVFAKQYEGTPYVWGGFRPTGWDCSGFVNYVLGHHFGMTLPGGFHWNGKWHGPTAAMYKVWGKAHNVAAAEPGDLCCWSSHIGIALGPRSMISAVDQQMGTAITGIAGPGHEKLTIRRINMVAATAPGGAGNAVRAAGRGCTITALMLPWLILKGVLARAWPHRKASR